MVQSILVAPGGERDTGQPRGVSRFLSLLCLVGVASLGLACRPSGPVGSPAEGANPGVSDVPLLVTGGTVVTLDSEGSILDEGAVAIEHGRIAAIGAAREIERQYPGAHRLPAGGRLILPGLINAHTHVPMVLFRGLADDIELMEWLEDHIFPAEAEHVDEEFVRWGTRLGCLEMLRGGTTTFVDMYYFEDVVAEEAQRCGIRAVVGETLIDFPAPDNESWEEAVDYTRDFVARWRGHPRISPAIAPHSAYTVSGEHLKQAHRLATELDVPLLTHLAEDSAEIQRVREATGMSSVQFLEQIGFLDPRLLAAHVIWPTPEEIELLARRGVGVAHCPQSNMKVAAGIAPVPAMLDAGVAVGLGTDGAASNNDLDLWEEIDTVAKQFNFAGFRKSVGTMLGMIVGGGILTWIFITDGVRDISLNLSNQLEPLYLADIGRLNEQQIGGLSSIANVAMAMVMAPAGWLAAKITERKTILLGFLIQFIGFVIFLAASSITTFAISWFTLGVGFAVVSPSYDSLISKVVPEQNRGLAYGLFWTSVSLLALPAPYLGGLLWDNFTPRTPFIITAVVVLLSTIPVWFKFKPPEEASETQTSAAESV